MSVNKLPNELLVAIFANVRDFTTKLSCRLVNRQWRTCGDDRQAWTAFNNMYFECEADYTISCSTRPIRGRLKEFISADQRIIHFLLQRLSHIRLAISFRFDNDHEAECVARMWTELMNYSGRIAHIRLLHFADQQTYFNAFGFDHICQLLQRFQPKSIEFYLV